MRYQKHVFVCCNEKEEGKTFCGEAQGMEMINQMRTSLLAKGINPKSDIRVQKSGCLGICKHGPAVAVYPEGTFYGNVSKDRLEELVQQHLIGDSVLEDLKLDA